MRYVGIQLRCRQCGNVYWFKTGEVSVCQPCADELMPVDWSPYPEPADSGVLVPAGMS